MSLVLLFHYLLLNMFRMLIHPSSGACDLLWIYFMCCISLVRCVLVLRCGSAGVVWYPYAGFSLHKDTTPLTFETCWAVNSEIIKRVTSSWSIFIERETVLIFFKIFSETFLFPSRAQRDIMKNVHRSEQCWAVNGEIIKKVTSSWSIFIQLSRWCTVQ